VRYREELLLQSRSDLLETLRIIQSFKLSKWLSMTFPAHGLIRHFLSPCKQQATQTELQAALKLGASLGASANSERIVTKQRNVSNTKSYPRYLQIQAK